MEPLNIPLVPQKNCVSPCTSTPDDGFLYIGLKSINYISKIETDHAPVIKAFHTRQRIKSIDCDPDWSQSKFFAALADDNSVQIWDFEDGKAKKGHRAHIKTPQGDGDGSSLDIVAICFLNNHFVLSIDSSCIINYCVSSNTYTKNKRIIPAKHKVLIVKPSPYDDKIVAVGTARGLVLLLDLKSESILFTLRGHDRDITSLSWCRISTPHASKPLIKEKPKRQNRKRNTHDTTADDIFDIYDFEYLDNEFGAPAKSVDDYTIDETSTGADIHSENVNFNFVEACRSLKDDIIALKYDDENNSVSDNLNISKQVTLKDCQESKKNQSDLSLSCDSDLSDGFGENSSSNSRDGDLMDVTEIGQDVTALPLDGRNKIDDSDDGFDVFLATGSLEGIVWLWNTKTGESVDKVQLKTGTTNNPVTPIDVCWLNDKTLITNDKSGSVSLFSVSIASNKKFTLKKEKREFSQHGVVALCKSKKSERLWTTSYHREIVCEDIVGNTILAKYSCASTNIPAIRENPDNMNKIAFAFGDHRIGLMELSNLSSTNVWIDNMTSKIDSSVLSMDWCPDGRFLAFGTSEGRVGVFDTEKPFQIPVLMKPFSGKQIYSIVWYDRHIFVCSNQRVGVYEWNGKMQDAIKIPNINQASAISVKDNYLVVGKEYGCVTLYNRETLNSLDFKELSNVLISTKYISEISWNPINPSKLVVSALSNDCTVLKITNNKLELEGRLESGKKCSGSAWVKWSNKNENLLLSCGFDGALRIWDVTNPGQGEMIFLKQFDSPMLCGIFSPLNENIVICAGKATSIEMFNYKTDNSSKFRKTMWKRDNDKPLGNVQWATRFQNNAIGSKDKRKNKKREEKGTDNDYSLMNLVKDIKDVKLETDADEIQQQSELAVGTVLKNQTTILHLTTKEFNKDAIDCLLSILDPSTDATKGKCLLSKKLFGSKDDVKQLLNDELKNHEASNTKSIGRILIPQINGNLKEEILKCVQSKTLTELHLSLAPTISFDFWKKCSLAYATQLLELGSPLGAIPYLLACHEIKDAIEHLINAHYYREAWVITKIHCEKDDPILEKMLIKWITYLDTNGQLEGAAYICALSEKYQMAYDILNKRRQMTDEHVKALELLKTK